MILCCFAGLGLLLAAIGIYGVIAYLVVQRTQEIRIRIALGAPRSAVVWLVSSQGLRMALAGVVVGLLGTTLAAGSLTGYDPHSFPTGKRSPTIRCRRYGPVSRLIDQAPSGVLIQRTKSRHIE